MKEGNKFSYTLLVIILTLTIVGIFKYFHFLKLPEGIKSNYNSFVFYPGVGGVIPIVIITVALYLLFDIWKKSKEEKLLDAGRKSEVEKIKQLHSEGILNEKDVNNKFDLLLKEVEKEQNQNVKNAHQQKQQSLIDNLSELKNKGILTEQEFEQKKKLILASQTK